MLQIQYLSIKYNRTAGLNAMYEIYSNKYTTFSNVRYMSNNVQVYMAVLQNLMQSA